MSSGLIFLKRIENKSTSCFWTYQIPINYCIRINLATKKKPYTPMRVRKLQFWNGFKFHSIHANVSNAANKIHTQQTETLQIKCNINTVSFALLPVSRLLNQYELSCYENMHISWFLMVFRLEQQQQQKCLCWLLTLAAAKMHFFE